MSVHKLLNPTISKKNIKKLTFKTKISPVVRLMSNLLFAGLSGSIPWPVKKYTIFCGLSLSPSVAVTCIYSNVEKEEKGKIKIFVYFSKIGIRKKNHAKSFFFPTNKMESMH